MTEMITTAVQGPVYQMKADVAPILMEFLNDVRPDDIVTELVQNDLDQGASHTRISFLRDRLIAEGNGAPVDEAGWRRLSYVLGAGVEVAEKRDGLGVKNHGLRSCFLIGDDIAVRSAGLRTQLTLRSGEPAARFSPGAWDRPVADEGAPARGCRIEVPFRTTPLIGTGGEGVELSVPSETDLTHLFLGACDQAPLRYIGCLRPGFMTQYVLELAHWQHGTYRFTYTVTPLRSTGRLRMYRRRCHAQTPRGDQVYLEEAILFAASTQLPPNRRIPRFFRSGSRIMLEVSWAVNQRGRPLSSSGRFRYPISYVGDDENANTRIGVNFSAPYVSDTTRHGLASAPQTSNRQLTEECEEAVIRVLREYLVPRFGPAALEILLDPDFPESERMKKLTLEAAKVGALPAAPLNRGKSGNNRRYRRVPPELEDDWAFIIPAVTWSQSAVSRELAELGPSEYPQLHPDCPGLVVKVLLEKVYQGEVLSYTSFDETDVIARLHPEIDGRFPWPSETVWKAELANPHRVRRYLDVINEASRKGKVSSQHIDALLEFGRLPDCRGEPTKWSDLYRAKKEIEAIPGVQTPNQVDVKLADHPILVRGRLQLRQFILDDYLTRLDFSRVGVAGREAFFRWIARNHNQISGATLKEIARYPIWPTTTGQYVSFDELCLPDPPIRDILGHHIKSPSKAVTSLRRVRRDGRGLLRLRSLPTTDELHSWYKERLSALPRGTVLTEDQRRDFSSFEGEIVTLRAHREIRARMDWLDSSHPGLSARGDLRPIRDLHLPTEAVRRCKLRPADLADSPNHDLYANLGANTRPTQAAVYRSLEEDSESEDALHARLAAYVEARKREGGTGPDIRGLPFLWVGGRKFAPKDVALRGVPDYWGEWKVPFVSGDGLSADQEANLRAVGVTGRRPIKETSRQFFEWLSAQKEPVVRAHLDQVIRHFLHEDGPLSWWERFSWIRCLPVYTHGRSVRLLTRREAFSGNPGPLLPDFRELENLILERDAKRRIVIVETEGIRKSILWKLREAGLRTVRQVVMPPVKITVENPGESPKVASELIEHLRSRRIQAELHKRLQEMDISDSMLRPQWHNEIRRIRSVRLAERVWGHFKCGSRIYRVEVPAGIDPDSGHLWISSDKKDPTSAIYEAVAERVFVPGAPKHYALALLRAVEMDYQSRFKSEQPPRDESAIGENAEEHVPMEASPVGRSTDMRKTHSVPKPDPFANQPSPEPFRPIEYKQRTPLRGDGPDSRQRGRDVKAKRTSTYTRGYDPIEREAIKKLKVKHYAYHCQVCLADDPPSRLAPEGSYAFQARNRRVVIHAHHVAPVHAEGPRVVSNILLLCKFHHDQLGDQLDPKSIRRLLSEGGSTPVSVDFPEKPGTQPTTIAGEVITLSLDKEPWNVRVFFTKEHARVWREATSSS